MLNVDNRQAVSLLSRRSLRAGRLRNMMAVLAIALTAILFTSLFTIGGSMIDSMEYSTMRQVGTQSHGGFKYLTQQQYDTLAQDPEIKDISYNIIAGFAANPELNKLQVEVRYSEDKAAAWGFSYPTTGAMPEERLELATSTLVLDALQIPHTLGQPVTLQINVDGKIITETFTLCGFWEGDVVAGAQQLWLAREYVDEIAPVLQQPLYETGSQDLAGCINADVWFANSWDIEGNMEALIARCGFDPERINTGVNWAYSSSTVDVTTLLLVGGVLLLILVSGYLIIYNIFYISVAHDIRFYGLLKTIGTTGKQLKRIVRRQALLLSCIGIPVGLALGYVLGCLLVPFVTGITSLGQDVVISFHAWIFIGAALFSLLTVFISCVRPCRLAAKVSPVEAVRYTEGAFQTKRKQQKRTKPVSPARMAMANLQRNRKKAVLVILSLSLSMILLNSVYTMVQGFDMEKYLENKVVSDFAVTHFSLRNHSVQYTELAGVTPQVLAEIRSLEGLEELGNVYMKEHRLAIDDTLYQRLTQIMRTYPETLPEVYAQEVMEQVITDRVAYSHIYGVDQMVAEKMTSQTEAGVIDWQAFASGNYVIVNDHMAEADPSDDDYYKVGEQITLDFGNGNTKTYQVMAVARVPYAAGPQHSHFGNIDLILPSSEFLAQYGQTQPMLTIFNVAPEQVQATEDWLAHYCSEVDTDLVYESKAIYEAEFYGLQRTFLVVGGALSFVLALIGVLNFLNAIVTSILARRREFAMLQSVGMTGGQLRQMLITEGCLYAFFTLLFTATLGTAIGYGLVQAVAGQMWFYSYHFTLAPVLFCTPVLLLLVVLIPALCYKMMCRQSLVERLRIEE